MNDAIIYFLEEQTCASLCCIDERENPYCFSCFFAFNSADGLLYFKSSVESQHALLVAENPVIAGTVLPDKLNRLLIKGIQFTGTVLPADNSLTQKAYFFYHKKFPMALAITGRVYAIEINSIKMTDSSKLFGGKLLWNKPLTV